MTVSPSKQFYYCFSCGAGGNSIKFLMEFTRANFSDVVLSLAKKNNINVENLDGPQVEAYKKQLSRKEELYKILKMKNLFFLATAVLSAIQVSNSPLAEKYPIPPA